MKKIVTVMLSLVLCCGLFAGCGDRNSDNVKLIDIKLTDEQYAYAVQQNDTEMLASINAFLAQITSDGTFDTILDKYFGDGTPTGVTSATEDSTKNQLVLVTTAAFAPFEYVEGNQFYGIDIEVAKLFADSRGEELVIKNIAFESVLEELRAGNADIAMAGLTVNEERKKIVTFSTEYYNASQMLLVRGDDTTFDECETAADVEEILNGWTSSKKIGYQNGTTGSFYIQGDEDWGFNGFPVTGSGYANGSLAVEDMINGNIDAVCIDEAPARKLMENFNRR